MDWLKVEYLLLNSPFCGNQQPIDPFKHLKNTASP